MKDFLVSQFLIEVKKVEKDHSEQELLSLKGKSNGLIEALCSKSLILYDPGTFALTFIVAPSPVYFQTFFQMKMTLEMLLSFIEKEDSYLNLPESELPEMLNYVIQIKGEIKDSYHLFSQFFKQDEEEQERIQCAIKNIRWLYSVEGILKQFEILSGSIEEEISYISELLQDLKSDKNLHLYFGKEREIFEAGMNQLLAEKSAEKAMLKMQGQLKEDFADVNARLDIFRPNGFRLFDYLMKNHLSTGIGWQSDIFFFFRKMEYDKLIHCKQTPFKVFIANEYPEIEPLGKFKLWNDINTEKRNQIYSSAKRAIGLK